MTAAMELLYLVAFLLLTRPGVTFGDNSEQRVVVMEGSDVVLPCSIEDTELNYQLFEWKEGQKEVFTYDAGIHSNNNQGGQDPQFKGRVSHFEDELRNGNASIKIRNTTVKDSGDYSCVFPRLQNQIFHIKLVVGAAAEPSVMILNQTKDQSLLQCVVRGASPKPTVEWRDSSRKTVPAKEPQITERGGSYDIVLQTTVTKTDRYRCVATQEEIKHQVYAEIDIYIYGAAPKPSLTTVEETADSALLQCDVQGAFPKPTVEWKDSAGKVLHSEVTHENEVDEVFDITLQTYVIQTGHYDCVVTQYDINHQVFTKTFVLIGPDSQSGSEMPWWGWLILVIGVVITFAALWFWLVLRKLRPCGPSHIRVFVKEGSDVVLPCSPGNLDLTKRVFIWKKGEQKVFLYAEGKIENGGPLGQDQQFRGRVSHFGGQLHLGNASITIHNTKVEDSGIYTCKFPGLGPLQTFSVKLIVVSADSEAASKVDDEAVPLSTKGPRDDRVV